MEQKIELTKTKKSEQRWKRRIIRYRQRFQTYIAYIAIIAIFSIILPFIIYYHFEMQALFALGILSLVVFLYISFSKRDFLDKASWSIIVIALPFFGALLFLFIGASQSLSKSYKKKRKQDEAARKEYETTICALDGKPIDAYTSENYVQQFYTIAPEGSYTFNNKFDFLQSQAVYDQMLEDIKKAEHHIHLEMYIARIDKTTQAIFDELKRKAQAGVKVRYLGDVLGHNLLKDKDIEGLIYSGIEFTFFNNKARSYFDHFHVNHRKMLIVDGKVGYTGGFNLGDEYVNGYPKKHLLWCDMMSRITGDMVNAMQFMFMSDWAFSQEKTFEEATRFERDTLFPHKIQPVNKELLDVHPPITQFLGDGPDCDQNKVKNMLRFLISKSKSRIYLTSPYLIPSDDLVNDLKFAAKKGIDVRIIIPGVPDKKLVYYCSESYIESLAEAGVKIYKMDKYFVHSKIYLFDTTESMFGTVNFDMRSFRLNFEENIVQINDPVVNGELYDIFKKIESQSTLVDLATWKKRPWYQKGLELFFRAFAPLF